MTNKKYENGLFIFRRDFRFVDNNGLYKINALCKNIYTIFIFTPEQVSSTKNEFKSNNAVQFMIESLMELSTAIHKSGGKLVSFYGHNDKIIYDCIKDWNIQCLGFNQDYTPYATERDDKIFQLCEKKKINCAIGQDYYLNEPDTIFSGAGTPYQKFTPYYKTCIQSKFPLPQSNIKVHFTIPKPNENKQETSLDKRFISLEDAMRKFTKQNKEILVHGGRIYALKRLKHASSSLKEYDEIRDNLTKQTSELSAYIKFGCISIREVYQAFRKNPEFVRQLVWRDFYANILYSFPYVLGNPMKSSYSAIRWRKSPSHFKAWCEGKTGYPIVDASMRQMNQSGYMHNRGRLIVASFLIKTLLINWEEGEKYFATMLTDYDPASNNGNWQWVASTGADSQPYFRIFNPWSQSVKHDPQCIFIKKWIPELQNISIKDIHTWYDSYSENKPNTNYPKPIVIYEIQREKAIEMYKKIFI
jgi:deoxyribodipyrimidine photo-lyase|tara:strand:+ start:3387 stop:4805 length:1419 start_codon:yes stop_codon:yes gene_type:complete